MVEVVKLNVWGEQAKKILERLGLEMDGDETDITRRVFIRKRSIEGRTKAIIEFDV